MRIYLKFNLFRWGWCIYGFNGNKN